MSTVHPIKSKVKIAAMRRQLRGGLQGLRDELIFLLGINTGFRCSDILQLTVGDVWTGRRPKEEIVLKEMKTGKVRATKLNDVVLKSIAEYLSSRNDKDEVDFLERPLFLSRKMGKSLQRRRVETILKEAALAVGIERISTHTLRKTFGYHAYKDTGNNLGLVQKLLNHARSGDTLRYIGITQEEMDNVFLGLKLG